MGNKDRKEMTPASLVIEEIMGKASLANPSSERTESRLENSFERSSSISQIEDVKDLLFPQICIICFLLFSLSPVTIRG